MMPAVLFVCTANICRSPMAAGIFKVILDERVTAGEWIVESAGTWGLDGEPPAAGSQAVLRSKGIEFSDHRSRSINEEIIQSFDLILTMENGQKEALRMEFPEFSDRIYLLSEMVNLKQDINDPYGGVYSEYEQAADEIEEYLTTGFDSIIQKASHSDRNG